MSDALDTTFLTYQDATERANLYATSAVDALGKLNPALVQTHPPIPSADEEALQTEEQSLMHDIGKGAQAIGSAIHDNVLRPIGEVIGGAVLQPTPTDQGTLTPEQLGGEAASQAGELLGVPTGKESPEMAALMAIPALGMLRRGQKIGKDIPILQKTIKTLSTDELTMMSEGALANLYKVGASISTPTVTDVYGRSGFATVLGGDTTHVVRGMAQPADLKAYLTRVQQTHDLHDPNVAVMTQFDRDTNSTTLHLVQLHATADQANAAAKALKQPVFYSTDDWSTLPRMDRVFADEPTLVGGYGLQALAKDLKKARDVQKRGTRSHATTRQAAAEGIASGQFSEEQFARLAPGATGNADALAAANYFLYHRSQDMQNLAVTYLKDTSNEANGQALLRAIGEVGKFDVKLLGLESETGRALEYVKEIDAATDRYVKASRNVLSYARTTGSLSRFAAKIAQTDAPEELVKTARILAAPGFTRMFVESWTNGLISGVSTTGVNVLSNYLSVVTYAAERAQAAKFGAGNLAKIDEVVDGEASHFLSAFFRLHGEAWTAASEAFVHDKPIFGQSKLDILPRERAITGENVNLALQRWSRDTELNASTKHMFDYLGVAANVPSRFLMAQDEFFKAAIKGAEIETLAWRDAMLDARSVGGAQKDISTRANANFAARMADVDQLQVYEQQAESLAQKLTFTSKLGHFGIAAILMQQHPIGKIVFPFITAPSNLAKTAWKHTPLDMLMKSEWEKIQQGGPEAQLIQARWATGSSFMAITGLLGYAGLITGSGPQQKSANDFWQEAGYKPWSINVAGLARFAMTGDPSPQKGDQWIPYNRIDYLGMLIGLSVETAGAMRDGADPNIFGEAAPRLATMAGRVFASKTYMQGAADWLTAVMDPLHYGEKLERSIAKSLVSAVPVVGPINRNLMKELDPYQRDIQGIVNALIASTPGSGAIPPQVNYWGEARMNEQVMVERMMSPFYRRTHKDDPVSKALADANVSFGLPEPNISGMDLTTNPAMKHDYHVLFGKESRYNGQSLYDNMKEVLDRHKNLPAALRRDPDGPLHRDLERVHHAHVSDARLRLGQVYPELAPYLQELQLERLDKREGFVPNTNLRPGGRKAQAPTLSQE